MKKHVDCFYFISMGFFLDEFISIAFEQIRSIEVTINVFI